MANSDFPSGLEPVRHKSGGEIRPTKRTLNAANTAIGLFDPVVLDSGGTVNISTSGARLLGVSAEKKAASAGGDILVYDDPAIIFKVQTASGVDFAQTHVGNLADLNTTAYSSTTDRSQVEVNLATVGTSSGQLRILELVKRPDNALGAHADILVEIYEHELSKEEPGTPGV